MCGICGRYNFDGRPVDEELIKSMNRQLIHRGPDAEGVYIDDLLGLGHRRLKIIDLSDTANQPMSTEDGRYTIVYNGEIYNYKDIKRQLKSEGYNFYSQSDTEVLLKSYQKWGEGCLKYLNGMFAFVIWDKSERKLFAARDRLGKKPFFYYYDHDKFIFASELKAISKNMDIKKELNPEAISDFLSLGYILSPKSIFKNICKLPAAHFLVVKDNGVRIQQYWRLNRYFMDKKTNINENEILEEFEWLLNDAVKIRLMSDVPLGVFLSGGIDSTSILAKMVDYSSEKVKTFSIGFREKTFSELNYAKEAANFFYTEHREKVVENELNFILGKIVRMADEPFADSSMIPMYYLSKMAKDTFTVALSGDGADEILAGYDTYLADDFFKVYQKIPMFFRNKILKLLGRIIPDTNHKVGLDYKIKQFIGVGTCSREAAHYWWRVIFSDKQKDKLLKQELKSQLRDYHPFDNFLAYFDQLKNADFLDRSLYVDIKTWLQDDILVKVDRMTMANSLESRAPFLDHRLVEFCASLPVEFKKRGMKKKYLLKKTMEGKIPKRIIHHKKTGFNAPVKQWLRFNNDYSDNELISISEFPWQALNGFQMLILVNLQKWLEQFM